MAVHPQAVGAEAEVRQAAEIGADSAEAVISAEAARAETGNFAFSIRYLSGIIFCPMISDYDTTI